MAAMRQMMQELLTGALGTVEGAIGQLGARMGKVEEVVDSFHTDVHFLKENAVLHEEMSEAAAEPEGSQRRRLNVLGNLGA